MADRSNGALTLGREGNGSHASCGQRGTNANLYVYGNSAVTSTRERAPVGFTELTECQLTAPSLRPANCKPERAKAARSGAPVRG